MDRMTSLPKLAEMSANYLMTPQALQMFFNVSHAVHVWGEMI